MYVCLPSSDGPTRAAWLLSGCCSHSPSRFGLLFSSRPSLDPQWTAKHCGLGAHGLWKDGSDGDGHCVAPESPQVPTRRKPPRRQDRLQCVKSTQLRSARARVPKTRFNLVLPLLPPCSPPPVSPTKALCNERAADWKDKFKPLVRQPSAGKVPVTPTRLTRLPVFLGPLLRASDRRLWWASGAPLEKIVHFSAPDNTLTSIPPYSIQTSLSSRALAMPTSL